MAKTIGIDLGTTNSCMAVLEGSEPTVIPNAGGRTHDTVRRRVRARRPAARRRTRKAPAGDEPDEHDLLDQALHGPQARGGLEEMTIVPYEVVKGPNETFASRRRARSTRPRRSRR